MREVLCFGNEFLEEDSLALQVVKELKVQGFEFTVCNSPESILNHEEVVVLDVAEGIKNVTLIDGINQLKTNRSVTMHDLDIGFFLKLSKKVGNLKKVRIVALPQKGKKEEIKKQLFEILKAI
jgi:Ni,Fe-hydrogenase maturation factor